VSKKAAIIAVVLVVCAIIIAATVSVIWSMRSEAVPLQVGFYENNETNKTINEDDSTENGLVNEIPNNTNELANQNVNGQNDAANDERVQPPELPNLHATARLAFVGDIMVHRWQLDAARVAPGSYDFNYKFRYITPYIQAEDFKIENLETTPDHG